jgi:hypothetical protein
MYGSKYWIGPYGVFVPNKYDSVVAADGSNILYKDGSQTLIFVANPLTRLQWLEKYTIEKYDGNRWYKGTMFEEKTHKLNN